jgi:predicted dehydrogenase
MTVVDVAVVGCGHMGRHHARVVASHPGCRLVAAVDVLSERAREVAERFGTEAADTVPDGVQAVIVATPTATHLDVAGPLLAQGRWCLVEKPLADNAARAAQLRSPRLAVGHVERFNPAVRAAGPMKPRYVEARRLAPPTGRSQDVDVVLDLMIHDLDLVLQWSSGEVEWFDAVGVAVNGPRLDTASVRLRTTDGITASLVASRVASAPERVVRVFEPGRYTRLDLMSGKAERKGSIAAADPRDALTAQLDAFLAAVRGEQPVSVDFSAGCRAVDLAERIGFAIAEG